MAYLNNDESFGIGPAVKVDRQPRFFKAIRRKALAGQPVYYWATILIA